MRTVTSTELQKNFGQYSALALREPLIITNNGRQTHILMSLEDCEISQNEQQPYRFKGKVTQEFEMLMQKRFSKHAETITKLSNC